MGKSFIQVKEKQFLNPKVLFSEVDMHHPLLDLVPRNGIHVLDEVNALQNVDGKFTDHPALEL